MKPTLVAATLLSASLVFAGADSRTDAATVSPATTNKPGTSLIPQSAATVRINASTTFTQLLAMPDMTVVQSADGKQSTTVGAIRAQMVARQQQVQRYISAGKLLTGGQIKLPSPRGTSTVAALHNIIAQENSIALSLRSTTLNKAPLINQALNPTPGIYNVNGKKTGFVLSPGTNVVIKGYGFGNSKSLAVVRGLPKGDVELTVVNWQDNEIWAQLPAIPSTMKGLPDGAVAVVVYGQHNGIQQYRLDGGTFYANRTDYIVTGSTVIRYFKLQFAPGAPAVEPVSNFYPAGVYMRFAYHDGDDSSTLNLNCWSPGVDYLTTIDPGRGFVVTGLTFLWGPTDSGDGDSAGRGGSRTFTPGYSLGDWNGNTFPVRWGVWREHTSPYIFDPSHDECVTEYVVDSVTLTGPAGVSPF